MQTHKRVTETSTAGPLVVPVKFAQLAVTAALSRRRSSTTASAAVWASAASGGALNRQEICTVEPGAGPPRAPGAASATLPRFWSSTPHRAPHPVQRDSFQSWGVSTSARRSTLRPLHPRLRRALMVTASICIRAEVHVVRLKRVLQTSESFHLRRPSRESPDAHGDLPSLERWVSVLNEQTARAYREIDRRSNSQQALLAINITASTALAAAVVSGRANLLVLLLLPLLPTCLGGQWTNHHRTIQGIGYYIRNQVEPALSDVLIGNVPPRFVPWEQFLRATQEGTSGSVEVRDGKWYRTWRLAVIATFHGVSAIALTLTFVPAVLNPEDTITTAAMAVGADVWPRMLWFTAVILTLNSARSMISQLKARWVQRPS